MGAELLARRVGDQRVLEGDVGDRVGLPVVADAVDDVPGRELERGVVDDDVVRAVEAERVVLALAVSLPGRMRMWRMMMFDWLAKEISPPRKPIPPPGAVWPAMVRLLFAETAVLSCM